MNFCGNNVLQPQWMQPPNFWNTPGMDMMDRNRNFMHIQHKSCFYFLMDIMLNAMQGMPNVLSVENLDTSEENALQGQG